MGDEINLEFPPNTHYSRTVKFLEDIRLNQRDLNERLLKLFVEISTNSEGKNKGGVVSTFLTKSGKVDKNGIPILEPIRRKTLPITPDAFFMDEGEKVLLANEEASEKDNTIKKISSSKEFGDKLEERLKELKTKGLNSKGR